MAVKLRLRRMGRKKRPFYRIVVADSRSPRDGRFIEEIGFYNPLTDPATVEVKEERALYWLGVGAIPTNTVKNILSRQGIILKFDLKRQGLPEEKIQEELKKWEVLQIERQRRLEAKKAEMAKKEEKEEEPVEAEAPASAETKATPETEVTPEAETSPKEAEETAPQDSKEETPAAETEEAKPAEEETAQPEAKPEEATKESKETASEAPAEEKDAATEETDKEKN